jgi:hypothetical protein
MFAINHTATALVILTFNLANFTLFSTTDYRSGIVSCPSTTGSDEHRVYPDRVDPDPYCLRIQNYISEGQGFTCILTPPTTWPSTSS